MSNFFVAITDDRIYSIMIYSDWIKAENIDSENDGYFWDSIAQFVDFVELNLQQGIKIILGPNLERVELELFLKYKSCEETKYYCWFIFEPVKYFTGFFFFCFLPSPYFEISIPFIILVGIFFFRFSKKEPTQKYRSITDVARILQDNNEL